MMSEATRISGPRFGYRPEIDGEALTTAGHTGLDQRIRGRPVDVDVVDDDDVLVPDPAQQGVTAPGYPCDSCDSW